jgi:RNA polymerase sigma factor (sigma-70 family)
MAINCLSTVVQNLRKGVLLWDATGLTDGQLLECFVTRRDDDAFAALVRRHGPMVWGVCHRVLHRHHDAEDAFQATFLVLVRKAASIASRELLANWLYGVAHRTALKAQALTAKRHARESQLTAMPERDALERDFCNDLQPVLDQELSNLPDKYRIPIVLCVLEGKTRKEASRQLGLPEGTVAAQLARGRALLAKRLGRHGVALSSGSLAALVLAQNAASAPVPASVVSSTIKAASLIASGRAVTTGVVSATVAALTKGVLKAMLITKLKLATAVVLIVAVSSAGIGLMWQRLQAADAATTQQPAPKVTEKNATLPDLAKIIGELKSGPQVGAKIPISLLALSVVHAEWLDAAGKKWDYIEQYGAEPAVLVFARSINDPLVDLIKRLDAEVARHITDKKKLHVLLVMLSDDQELEKMLKDIAEKQGIKHVSLAIDWDTRNSEAGPKAWDLAKDADATIILYNRRKVEASHSFRKGEMNEKTIGAVMADLPKIVVK